MKRKRERGRERERLETRRNKEGERSETRRERETSREERERAMWRRKGSKKINEKKNPLAGDYPKKKVPPNYFPPFFSIIFYYVL